MGEPNDFGKGQRSYWASAGRTCPPYPLPRPGTPQSPGATVHSPPHRRPSGAAQQVFSTPSSAPLLGARIVPGGGGAQGYRRTPQRALTSARASVRPSTVCRWDCGVGEAPTGSYRASTPLRTPPPSTPARAPRSFGGTEQRRRDQGTGAAPAGGGGSCGARRGGAGVFSGPRPGGDVGAIIPENKGGRVRLSAPRAWP